MDIVQKNKQKASILILLIGIILIILVWGASPSNTAYEKYSIHTAEDAADFLSQLGWIVDSNKIEYKTSYLPEQFDELFISYNDLQLQQGCDLTKYAGKEITVYTIPITNYNNTDQIVYATLIVHNQKLIGGDIHSAEMNGFMHTLQ